MKVWGGHRSAAWQGVGDGAAISLQLRLELRLFVCRKSNHIQHSSLALSNALPWRPGLEATMACSRVCDHSIAFSEW